jgi:tetratricopeptide (TPR) repeat protein
MRRFLFFIFIIFCISSFCQIEIEEVGVINEEFDKAMDFFKNYKFEKCYQKINPIVESFKSSEDAGKLQSNDESLYKRSLELRGVSLFMLGKETEAKEDFSKIIKLDPNHNLEITGSTKITRFYNSIRDSLCGILNISIEPEEATLTVDSKAFNHKMPIHLLEGLHIVKVELLGYDSFSKEIRINPSETVSESVKLKPNSRKVYFFIKPKGAKLIIDDKFFQTADINSSEKLDWASYVASYNLDPKEYFVAESLYLPQGNHKIKVTLPCFEEKVFTLPITLDFENNKPGYIKPIALSKETVLLEVESYPSNAKVEIDGSLYGMTPLKLRDFCSGEHSVRIYKENQGEYRGKIELRNVKDYLLRVKLRPTLLYVGITSDQETLNDATGVFGLSLKQKLQNISSFNVKFSEEQNPLLPDLFFTKGVNEAEQRKTVKSLCQKYNCEGIIVAKTFIKGENKIASLRLFVPEFDGFDETTSLFIDNSDPSFLLNNFDKIKEEEKFVISVTDSEERGVILLCFDPSNRDLQKGDKILKVNGVSVSNESEFIKQLGGGKERVTLSVERGSLSKDVELKKSKIIKLFLSKDEGLRKRFLLDRQSFLSSENNEEKITSEINLGISLIYLDDYKQALSFFEKIDLDEGNLFLSNSVKYLKSLCLYKEGNLEEAKKLLSEIASDKSNPYLGNTNEVLISPLVSNLYSRIDERR